ncbi:MAG: divergent PAP2 family protein [Clostridia bacterium]|nr:divergent PAP2 family protein [Clostridia bacterium]
MHFLKAFFHNYVLVCSGIGYAVAQLLKLIITICRERRLSLRILISSGGMPSSHAATVAAMTTAVGRTFGVASGYFAISFVFASIVMYDAAGVRRETGEQGKLLNILARDLADRADPAITMRHFKELVGHTPMQVLAGALLGLIIPFLYVSGV